MGDNPIGRVGGLGNGPGPCRDMAAASCVAEMVGAAGRLALTILCDVASSDSVGRGHRHRIDVCGLWRRERLRVGRSSGPPGSEPLPGRATPSGSMPSCPVLEDRPGDCGHDHLAIGHRGGPVSLAETVVFLASRASDYVSGASITVDGGFSIRD